MLQFQKLEPESKALYQKYLNYAAGRGCEYAFANLYMWGRQRAAFVEGYMVLFSQFSRRSVYPWPVGTGDIRPALEAIISDAAKRGIPCRITGLGQRERELLEQTFPGRFRIHNDRDGYDYVYAIEDLAELKGRKYQRKRNHFNRFCQSFPGYETVELTPENIHLAQAFSESWFARRLEEEPDADFLMEQAALKKAFAHFRELQMEGMLLLHGGQVLAMTLGSPLSEDIFDIHFEKADGAAEGAYAAINCLFARHLRKKFPALKYLNREDDMGLEGLRKAKLSYLPHHLVEKSWACLLEDGCEY